MTAHAKPCAKPCRKITPRAADASRCSDPQVRGMFTRQPERPLELVLECAVSFCGLQVLVPGHESRSALWNLGSLQNCCFSAPGP